ncbi:MAG: tRNA lysidine(34) synthetase TilS [Thermodesulfobacteriaceae bacterium]|nr:tRNA lysidine(34) synthetase TilS [Thermodesulfobacteriaceae bacterium]
MNWFLRKLRNYIENFGLFREGERILVGVSGGIDSISLLEALFLLQKYYHFKLFVSHYDHKLRKSSLEDAFFVYQFCKNKGISFLYTACCVSKYAKKEKISLEMAGRELRYNLWYDLAKKYDFQKIALAHHLDDLIEEIFLKLIRGTGKRGLAGIPVKREDLIVRPFLFFTKEEIKKFALERNLSWKEDLTNRDIRFLRNRIRHLLIPFLEKKFSKTIKENIKRTAFIIAEEEELIEELAQREFEKLKFYLEEDLALKLTELKLLSPVLRKRVYFLAFKEAQIPLFRITYPHLESLENLITKSSKGPVYLPGNFLVYRGPGYLRFTKKLFTLPYFEMVIDREKEIELPSKQKIKIYKTFLEKSEDLFKTKTKIMYFLAKRLSFPFLIRKRKPGDTLFIPSVGHKKLKKFLWEKSIPSYERDRIIIIEHQNEIVGVWNLYIHPEYEVKNFPEEVLILEIIS